MEKEHVQLLWLSNLAPPIVAKPAYLKQCSNYGLYSWRKQYSTTLFNFVYINTFF
jgi:hypothetical protein